MKSLIKNLLYSPYYKSIHLLNSLPRMFNRNRFSITSANDFINKNNFASNTSYLIWVDTSTFKVNIFTGSQNNWQLVKSFLCSIGKPATPTPKGNFTLGTKGLYFGINHGYKAWYYYQIKGNYFFHSILYNLNGSIRDGRLGFAISNGCVRLAKENAKWIWDNIPKGTFIHIS